MRARTSLLLAALALLGPLTAAAQICVVPDHLPPARLIGAWNLTLWPENASEAEAGAAGQLRLNQHPEYAASVRGELTRSSGGSGQERAAAVSGDVTEGEFHLDESEDGERITAVWSGVAEDCAGRIRITGLRRPAGESGAGEAASRFRLERVPSW